MNQEQTVKQDDTPGYLELLDGTLGLYLLIRVSQVRDLYGLVSKKKVLDRGLAVY